MVNNSRNVCSLSAEKLLNCATLGGARSLGLLDKVGTFEVIFLNFHHNFPSVVGLFKVVIANKGHLSS